MYLNGPRDLNRNNTNPSITILASRKSILAKVIKLNAKEIVRKLRYSKMFCVYKLITRLNFWMRFNKVSPCLMTAWY